jgi:hypothetical protein
MTEESKMQTVNVDEGFYPRFSEFFKEHYGGNSSFVLALADAFTFGLFEMMKSKDLLVEGSQVLLLGTVDARKGVIELIKSAPDIQTVILQESFGTVPLGSYRKALDEIKGASFFDDWLHQFSLRYPPT